MSVGVRAAYPEQDGNWFERLQGYERVGYVEVAFYRPHLFLEIRVDDVIAPFDSLSIKSDSVHMAQERLKNENSFISILSKTIEIAKELNSDKIVVHPSRDRSGEIKEFVNSSVTPLLEDNEIYLCWETFESRKRFLSGIREITEFCENNEWYGACYDFSHVSDPQEKILEDIKTYRDHIKIFHMSNRISEPRKQHLPIFEKGDLNFNEILGVIMESYDDVGMILEYLHEYHHRLVEDALKVKEMME